MKVTKSQKIYLSALCVGVCAFILDECFGNPVQPKPAVDGQINITPSAMPVSTQGAAGQTISTESPETMAEKLDDLRESQPAKLEARDAFAIPASFGPASESSIAPNEKVIHFRNSHKLKAILSENGLSQVVVDQSLIKSGEYFDGFHLESASHMEAVFSDGISRVELQINQPDGLPSAR